MIAKRILPGLAALALLAAMPAAAEPAHIPEKALPVVKELQAKALAGGSPGYALVESLTTEVGPRLTGTPGDAAAVKWAVAKFKELGFDKVWTEPVVYKGWIRGTEKAAITAPFPQNLVITGLGYTVATPPGGVEAEVAYFASYEELLAAPEGSLNGKIAFVNEVMIRHTQGHGYGFIGAMRGDGPVQAARRGASALLIRSLGTHSHRFPHTGVTEHDEGVRVVPSAALSPPDADQLRRIIVDRGQTVRVKLELATEFPGQVTTHNVIGELRGRETPDEIVLIGAHLDSWDLGTGALDDGAGVGIVMGAGKLIRDLPKRPRRTVRVVLFAAEEIGLVGAKAYAEAHKDSLAKHVIATEADFGAGPIYALSTYVHPDAEPALTVIRRALGPLRIIAGDKRATGGPDVSVLRAQGVPVVSLQMDGSDYFDYHHTPDDTFDKVDRAKLEQSIAAYATFTWLAAEATGTFGPISPPGK
ncbi:MAG TPA: M20/M25/M40 family metallo-hydrolase [Azospirillaceae bacterium]|nr:M20/M25/M40 family metallo-hydrolase [Azospirillaceae bacterium]